jgi:hypothetical protein
LAYPIVLTAKDAVRFYQLYSDGLVAIIVIDPPAEDAPPDIITAEGAGSPAPLSLSEDEFYEGRIILRD